MDRSDAFRGLCHVVVVGGGFAALETVLGLRALAGDAVRISLVSPERVFAYRPAATLEAFGDVAPSAFDLDAIAADLGVGYHRTRVESVAGVRRRVRLGSGGRLTYDALVLAAGARATVGVPGALTFRDQRDLPRFRVLLRELDERKLDSLVFAVPSGTSWPLPLYELAMLSATHAGQVGAGTQITLVSPEQRPLAVFGTEASELVATELAGSGECGSWAAAPLVASAAAARSTSSQGLLSGRIASWPCHSSGERESLVYLQTGGDLSPQMQSEGSKGWPAFTPPGTPPPVQSNMADWPPSRPTGSPTRSQPVLVSRVTR